jgi:type IV secretory pathway ATPase VirB11/archaellum biosynthesis ATPase
MGITIIIRGPHNSGKTTAASLIKNFLEENGYYDVKVEDVPPMPVDEKPQFWDRFTKNRERPVRIKIELEE